MTEVYLTPPPANRKQQRVGRSHLDSTRFLQAVQYIDRYGSPNMLVAFYMRHNSMREAVSYLLKQQVAAQVFVDEIIQPSLRRDSVDDLLKVLSTQPAEAINEYLVAACRFLATANAPHLLYKIQVWSVSVVGDMLLMRP